MSIKKITNKKTRYYIDGFIIPKSPLELFKDAHFEKKAFDWNAFFDIKI